MCGDINIELRWIFIVMFTVTQGLSDNITGSRPSLTPVTLPRGCQGSDGQFYNIGDVWKPKPNSECSCSGVGLILCSERFTVRAVCRDQEQKIRNPGDEWLINPTTKCSCSQNNLVSCLVLKEPACMDSSGKIRGNMETWMKNDCIKCMCLNGSINCTKYDVNVTYGLFEVKTHPICERCVHLMAADSYAACEAFFGTAVRYRIRPNLFRCFNGDYYIWDSHRCNGILDCPDGSDEKDCEDKMCKDEVGALYLIKDSNVGWQVSPCLRRHCTGDLLTCLKRFVVNFPGEYHGYYSYEENCTQPSCKVSQFIRDNKDKCQGVEILEDKGILLEGQTWTYSGCKFYFPGSKDEEGTETCPPMVKPVCYVYNGAVCCAFHCPALEEMSKQMRGNLSVCSNGHQLVSSDISVAQCKTSNCLRNYSTPNCTTEITCQDENFNKYFEGTTWSVGECIQCSCRNGTIKCRRKVSVFTSSETLFENCNQTECNVMRYIEANRGKCRACRWNGKVHYDGDQWKENGVDFYCVHSSRDKRVRPGCYVGRYTAAVECTGAIKGIKNLSSISKDDLFLCDSGDEIIWGKYRCDLRMECYDFSDEKNCYNYFCHSEKKFGLQWPRTKTGKEIAMECSLIDSTLTGTFSGKCGSKWGFGAVWFHKHKCGCVRKTLVDYFKQKIQEVNDTNLMSISTEFTGSHKRFKNKKVFHDMLNELFDAARKVISPITTNNSKLAIQFSEQVIRLEVNEHAYHVSPRDSEAFCEQPDLAKARYNLAVRVLEFLRTAPNITDAYYYGLRQIPSHAFKNPWAGEQQLENFGSKAPQHWISIARTKLIVQLNKAPLVSPRVVTIHSEQPMKPMSTVSNSSADITQQYNTTTYNKTDEPSNNLEEIKAILAANNCPHAVYDEEKDTFIVHSSTVINKQHKIQRNLELVLLCVSVVAVMLSLTLLSIIRVKRSERIFVHKNLLFSLGLGNLIYVLDITLFASRKNHVAICCFVAVSQHYLHTSLFTWMLVEGINLYIKLVKVFTVNKQYLTYLTVGWGIPAVIIGLTAAIHPSTYDMGEIVYGHVTCGKLKLTEEIERARCWINGSLWIYKGPVLAILLINFAFFVIILRVVFGKIVSKYGKNNINATRKGARSIVALLPLLGVTWLLGFFVDFHDAVKYAFILVNSTMGVIFCIFHCVLDDQVRDALRARKILKTHKSDQKTATTPASNPSTPLVEKNNRINKFTYPGIGDPFSNDSYSTVSAKGRTAPRESPSVPIERKKTETNKTV